MDFFCQCRFFIQYMHTLFPAKTVQNDFVCLNYLKHDWIDKVIISLCIHLMIINMYAYIHVLRVSIVCVLYLYIIWLTIMYVTCGYIGRR